MHKSAAKHFCVRFLVFVIFAFSCVPSFAFQSLPLVRFSAGPYLDDESGTLTNEQRDGLSKLIAAQNRKGLGRIFVLILKNLPEGRTLERTASLAINQEPSSPNERPDRILILAAIKERRVRIETSRDVWNLLPDAFCHSVINEQMSPAFRKSDFYSGIRAAVEALSKKLRE